MDAEISALQTTREATDMAVALIAQIRLLTRELLGDQYTFDEVDDAQIVLQTHLPQMHEGAAGATDAEQAFAAAVDRPLGDRATAVHAALLTLAQVRSYLEILRESGEER